MTHRIAALSLFGASALVGGCVEEPSTSVASLRARGGSNPCPTWGCGANSPVIDTAKGFHDLNLDGLPNEADMSLHSPALVVKDRPFRLSIEDNRIVGRGDDGTVLSGLALVGAEILIDTPDASPAYTIAIEGVRTMDYPFPSTYPRDEVEVYVFRWRSMTVSPDDPSGYSNVCSNPPFWLLDGPGHGGYSELFGMKPDEALIFSGDRIYAGPKKMRRDAEPGWFNIGCAGHTLAKLHLTRNTLASASATVAAPSHEKRQATLKLLTADYCGTGHAFTVAGQPLQWKGQSGDAADYYYDSIIGIEARWDEAGATCLTTPRMAISDLKAARELYPDALDVWEDIKAECATAGRKLPPPCHESDAQHVVNELRVSANAGDPPPDPPAVPPSTILPSVFQPIGALSRTRLIVPRW